MCVCVARNALDSMAGQHKVDVQQARQQAVDEYRANAAAAAVAAPCEERADDVSDTSLLTETHAANAVSSLIIHTPAVSSF